MSFPGSARGIVPLHLRALVPIALDGEGAQFASLELTALAGAALPRASSSCDGDFTDRLTFDFALATPHTLPRRCVGLSLNEA